MSLGAVEPAAAFSSGEGNHGVLLIHGFTGQTYSLRPLAMAFARSGFAVELPLLPGHGTSVEDLETCRFSDWTSFLEAALEEMSTRVDDVVLVGHSMGGTLACWLAERHDRVAGVILINPLIRQTTRTNMALLRRELAEGKTTFSSKGSDIKRPGQSGGSYGETPIRPLLSLLEGAAEVERDLAKIDVPVLLFTSTEDHVVPPASGDTIVERVHGGVERVYLENSYHTAMLDYDAPELESRSVAFARKVVSD